MSSAMSVFESLRPSQESELFRHRLRRSFSPRPRLDTEEQGRGVYSFNRGQTGLTSQNSRAFAYIHGLILPTKRYPCRDCFRRIFSTALLGVNRAIFVNWPNTGRQRSKLSYIAAIRQNVSKGSGVGDSEPNAECSHQELKIQYAKGCIRKY